MDEYNEYQEWWNSLTKEEQEREKLELMEQAALIADYEQMARNEIMLDGEQHPVPNPEYDDIPW